MSIFWNIKISKYLETAATKTQKKKGNPEMPMIVKR